MYLKTGVLIIGSLWWDTTMHRPKWRERLDVAGRVRVYAPIHYGRFSRGKHRRHYTMTFDIREPARWAAGRALLVPTAKPVGGFEDLWEEARALWDAERGCLTADGVPTATVIGEPKTSGDELWGTAGLLSNDDQLKARWRDAVEAKKIVMPQEAWFPVGSQDGLARFSWPTVIDGGTLADFDATLIAASLPDKDVPTASVIAARFDTPERAEYLHNNRRAGIKTAEDQQILAAMTAT